MKHDIPNLWNTAKAVLGGKFIPLRAYIRKQKRSQISYQSYLIKNTEKEEQINSKVNRKEIINIIAEWNRKQKNSKEKSITPKAGSLKNRSIKLINLSPDWSETKSVYITNIRNGRENISIVCINFKKIIMKCCEKFYGNRCNILDEMTTLFERHEWIVFEKKKIS